ncbi:MAG: hypothetical protein ACRD3W_16830 [Terriglobales bacterium]
MADIEYGNCYNFDLPDERLNDEETRDVIAALLRDLRKTPTGKTFVLDIAIGPHQHPKMGWEEFQKTRKVFKRAEFEKESDMIRETDIIHFLREHFDDMLTLPKPGLRRIK